MVRKLFTTTVLALGIFSLTATAGQRYLLHLRSDGKQEAIQMSPKETAKNAILRMEHGVPMRMSKADGLIDTLKNYSGISKVTTNFGFTHQDVAFEYFLPPTDGFIREFWWFSLKGGDTQKGLVRAWNANPALLTLPPTAVEATGNMGWYSQGGDGDGKVTPYKADADSATFIAGPAGAPGIAFDPLGTESPWKPGGVLVPLDTSLNATTGVWNHIKLFDVAAADTFKVVKGQPFGFTIQNNSPVGGADGRMEILSATVASAPYPSMKFYEIGRTVAGVDPGWWIRSYYWGEYVVVEYTGDRAPNIHSVSQLFTTLKTTSRAVAANVTDDNPGGGAAGIASVSLKWKKGTLGTYTSVAMTGTEPSYSGTIPGAVAGDSIFYYVEATDVNANVSKSKEVVYTIFAKANDFLCLYNFRTAVPGVPREQLVGLYLTGIDNFDIWDVGMYGVVDLPDLLPLYDKVAEIAGDGSNDGNDVINTVGTWLGTGTTAKPKLYFLSDQDHGWISGFADTTFDDSNVHAKYFGVKTLGPQDYPYYQLTPNASVTWPWNLIVDANATKDSVVAFISAFEKANDVTFWYHPYYELLHSATNWMDEVVPTSDARVLFRDTTGGHNRVVGVRKMAADRSWSTVYLGFDYFGTDFRSDTSKTPALDPKYTWILDAGNPLAMFFEYPFQTITGVKTVSGNLPREFALQQNYPNPFNPTTLINYSIAKNSHVTLKVYNLMGQEVRTLVNQEMEAGTYSAPLDASNLASGVYLYTLNAGSFVKTQKMVLLK